VYREADVGERTLVLRPPRRRAGRLVLGGGLVLAIAGAILFVAGSGASVLATLAIVAPAAILAAAFRPHPRIRVRRTGAEVAVERVRGAKILSREVVPLGEVAVEIARRRSGDEVVGYGLVLRAGERRIALDDARDPAMNDPLARQAELARFLERREP
jgi:hypothetical protein